MLGESPLHMARNQRRVRAPLTGIILLLLAGLWLGSAVQAQTLRPHLAIDDATIEAGAEIVELVINFDPHGVPITALAFSLDLDPKCLGIPATVTYMDGVPDFMVVQLGTGKTLFFSYDEADTDGELDIAMMDQEPPLELIEAGPLMTLSLDLRCAALPDAADYPLQVRFSQSPTLSIGDIEANDVAGDWSDGVIRIEGVPPIVTTTPTVKATPSVAATLIKKPTATPTPTSTPKPKHTPTATSTPTNTPVTPDPIITPLSTQVAPICLPLVHK